MPFEWGRCDNLNFRGPQVETNHDKPPFIVSSATKYLGIEIWERTIPTISECFCLRGAIVSFGTSMICEHIYSKDTSIWFWLFFFLDAVLIAPGNQGLHSDCRCKIAPGLKMLWFHLSLDCFQWTVAGNHFLKNCSIKNIGALLHLLPWLLGKRSPFPADPGYHFLKSWMPLQSHSFSQRVHWDEWVPCFWKTCVGRRWSKPLLVDGCWWLVRLLS